jgi:hypothetical protein
MLDPEPIERVADRATAVDSPLVAIFEGKRATTGVITYFVAPGGYRQ